MFLTLGGRSGRAARVRQRDTADCGAACLASVAGAYGSRVPVARIRQWSSTDRRGTNVLGMVEGARQLGFLAKGVRGSIESLQDVPLPSIAHVVLSNGLHHFVVLTRVTRRKVSVMDPADGRFHTTPVAEFQKRWTGVLILVAPADGFTPTAGGPGIPARFWTLVRPHRWIMLQALLGAVVYTILGLAGAVYVQKVVDHVLLERNRNLLNLLSLAMLLLIAAQVYIGAAKNHLTLTTGQRIDAALILGYYRQLLRLPQAFFDSMRVGEILSRVNDAVRIRAFINATAVDIVLSVLMIGSSLGLMMMYSVRLALVVAAVLPAYAVIYLVANRLNRRYQRETMERGAELESQLVESLSCAGTLKRFRLEEEAELKTEARLVRLLRPIYSSGVFRIRLSAATEALSRTITVAVVWVGGMLVLERELTPGELMSFFALVGYLSGPAMSLVAANQSVQDALIAADRLFEILDLEPEPAEPTGETFIWSDPGIRFQNVTFRYGSRTRVFENLDLEIEAGKLTAVVGRSGCGKSTLAALVQRLYPVDEGRVEVAGLDVREIPLAQLRRRIAVVPQRVDLIAGTIIENVALGESRPDIQRLVQTCDRVGASTFVHQLPGGFQTMLGERGASLSGGQQQLLALARALYREPSILMLDEATSALDPSAESQVRSLLAELVAAGTTVLMIAHRLSSVVDADRIVVIDGGSVAETGTHEELMRRKGKYAGMWEDYLGVRSPPLSRRSRSRTRSR